MLSDLIWRSLSSFSVKHLSFCYTSFKMSFKFNNTFHVFLDGAGVRATALYNPQSSTSSLSESFCALHQYWSCNRKVQLGFLSIPQGILFSALWNALSSAVFLATSSWVVIGLHTSYIHFQMQWSCVQNLSQWTLTLEFLNKWVFALLIKVWSNFLGGSKSNFWSIARSDSMGYDMNSNLIDHRVIGPGAAVSHIGSGATFSKGVHGSECMTRRWLVSPVIGCQKKKNGNHYISCSKCLYMSGRRL